MYYRYLKCKLPRPGFELESPGYDGNHYATSAFKITATKTPVFLGGGLGGQQIIHKDLHLYPQVTHHFFYASFCNTPIFKQVFTSNT